MLQLICHSNTLAVTVETFEAATERFDDGRLWLRFHLEGQLEALELGEPKDPQRTAELWQTTCFEVFLRQGGADRYIEYNFARSGQWAAYAFDDYRSGMTNLAVRERPAIFLDASDSHFAIDTEIILPPDWQNSEIELNLSAVIEETDGTKSYWALAHPPGKPDFHHRDCFALKLKAPSHP